MKVLIEKWNKTKKKNTNYKKNKKNSHFRRKTHKRHTIHRRLKQKGSGETEPIEPAPPRPTFTRQQSSRRIAKFFQKTEPKRKAIFLSAICSDSGQCITFGLEIGNIKKLFNNFNFDYANVDKIKRVGAISSNGFVTEIPYTRENYTSYAILKSSMNPNSDNLYYEAFVGVFVNKMNLLYPCFLETYGSYLNDSTLLYRKLQNNETLQLKWLQKALLSNGPMTYDSFLDEKNVNKSCGLSKYMTVLVQHVKNAESIHDHMNKYKHREDFISLHLVNYLFQIYCPLSMMSNEFTHYDLHSNNVLIYNPSNTEDKYVRMVYHYKNGETVEFNTFGITKIIDYGRCYFNDTSVSPPVSSMNMYNIVSNKVKTFHCYPNGEHVGYNVLGKDDPPGSFYYISSQVRNKSHDLRLVKILAGIEGKNRDGNAHAIRKIFANVFHNYFNEYMLKNGISDEGMGMAEMDGIHYMKKGDDILNVKDMHVALKDLIQNEPYFKTKNDAWFQGKTKIGELHTYLYDSKPMEYKPN